MLKPPKDQFWVSMYNQLADPEWRKTIADVCSKATTSAHIQLETGGLDSHRRH